METEKSEPLLLYSLAKVKELTGISESTWRREIKAGHIPGLKVRGRGPFLRPADLEAYLASGAGQAVPTNNEESTCNKNAHEIKMASTSGKTARTGGPVGSTDKAKRLAEVLEFAKKTTRDR
jgi:hypothetical protein